MKTIVEDSLANFMKCKVVEDRAGKRPYMTSHPELSGYAVLEN